MNDKGCIMICSICGVIQTDNPDGICDDCKLSIISSDDIPPNEITYEFISIRSKGKYG